MQVKRREKYIKARVAMAVHQVPTYNHLYESVQSLTLYYPHSPTLISDSQIPKT